MKTVAIEKHLKAAFTKAGNRWPVELGSQPDAAAVAAASRANKAGTAVAAVHAMLLRPEGANLQQAADAATVLMGAVSPIHVNKVSTNLKRGMYVALDASGKPLAAMPKLGKVETVRLALPDAVKPASKRKAASKATAAKAVAKAASEPAKAASEPAAPTAAAAS